MRTTLKLAEEDQKTLRAIAEERGERGVSKVVEEAIALYLTERNRPAELAPAVVAQTATPSWPTPVLPAPGRWQRLGSEVDRRLEGLNGNPAVVVVVRLLSRGLRRFQNA
jgi:hypothetical protein